MPITINIAGRIKELPATMRPLHPCCRYPIWIAISVEFGPGMRFVAPNRSRKVSRESHRRRLTTSSSIKAMCTAGPPKAVVHSLRNKTASSRNELGTDEELGIAATSSWGSRIAACRPGSETCINGPRAGSDYEQEDQAKQH